MHPKLILQRLVCDTKELLLSVEHVYSAQRASALLSKLKRSFAKTLGASELVPRWKSEHEVVLQYKVHNYLACALTPPYRGALTLL